MCIRDSSNSLRTCSRLERLHSFYGRKLAIKVHFVGLITPHTKKGPKNIVADAASTNHDGYFYRWKSSIALLDLRTITRPTAENLRSRDSCYRRKSAVAARFVCLIIPHAGAAKGGRRPHHQPKRLLLLTTEIIDRANRDSDGNLRSRRASTV